MLLVSSDLFSPVLVLLLLMSHFNTWKGHCLTTLRHRRIDNDDGNFTFPRESNYATRCLTLWCKQNTPCRKSTRGPVIWEVATYALCPPNLSPPECYCLKFSALKLLFELRYKVFIISVSFTNTFTGMTFLNTEAWLIAGWKGMGQRRCRDGKEGGENSCLHWALSSEERQRKELPRGSKGIERWNLGTNDRVYPHVAWPEDRSREGPRPRWDRAGAQ